MVINIQSYSFYLFGRPVSVFWACLDLLYTVLLYMLNDLNMFIDLAEYHKYLYNNMSCSAQKPSEENFQNLQVLIALLKNVLG